MQSPIKKPIPKPTPSSPAKKVKVEIEPEKSNRKKSRVIKEDVEDTGLEPSSSWEGHGSVGV